MFWFLYQLPNQAVTILKSEVPYYCLFNRTYSVVASKELQGMESPVVTCPYAGAAGWYLEY